MIGIENTKGKERLKTPTIRAHKKNKTDEISSSYCSEMNGKQKQQNSPSSATAAGECAPTAVAPAGPCRMTRSRVNRRNTMDCAILNEMFIDDDSKHTDKRSKQLLRESERDMKRASVALVGPMASGLVEATNPKLHLEERAESMPVTMRNVANGLQSGPLLVSFFFFFNCRFLLFFLSNDLFYWIRTL